MGAVTETGPGLSEIPGTFCSPALGVSSVCRADPGASALRLLCLTETLGAQTSRFAYPRVFHTRWKDLLDQAPRAE